MGADRDQRPGGPPTSEELLRLVLDSARDYAIFSMDQQGRVTSWNPGAENVLGFSAAEILGQSADVIFTPEDIADAVPQFERHQAAAVGRAEDERWQQRKDGTRFWASGLMMRLDDPNQGFVKILRDRTEQHQAAEERRQVEERFRLLATNIPQLVFRSLADGNRTWPSPQWIEFTGLGSAESLGLGWVNAVHPEDREATMAGWLTAEATGEYSVEHRVRRASDGEYRWHQTRARPIRGPSGGASVDWVGTMTDVHELRGLQGRQQVLLAELQHRTRNLLALIQAVAAQTLRKSSSLKAFGTEFEGRLAALSRVQAMLSNTDRRMVDLRGLVRAELNAHDAQEEAGKVRVTGPSLLLPATSAQTLALAVHELATNAVKYGALAQEAGVLQISWRTDHSGDHRLTLEWKESNVAMPVGTPPRIGYGSELIRNALPYQLGADTDLLFEPDGVRCKISLPIPVPDTAEAEGVRH